MEKYVFELIEIKRKGETSHQQDDWKEHLYAYPTVLAIGSSAEIPINDGRVLRTSVVKNFKLIGNYMTIETNNTTYEFRK